MDYPTHSVKRKLLSETCNKPRILRANFGFETETSYEPVEDEDGYVQDATVYAIGAGERQAQARMNELLQH